MPLPKFRKTAFDNGFLLATKIHAQFISKDMVEMKKYL